MITAQNLTLSLYQQNKFGRLFSRFLRFVDFYWFAPDDMKYVPMFISPLCPFIGLNAVLTGNVRFSVLVHKHPERQYLQIFVKSIGIAFHETNPTRKQC